MVTPSSVVKFDIRVEIYVRKWCLLLELNQNKDEIKKKKNKEIKVKKNTKKISS